MKNQYPRVFPVASYAKPMSVWLVQRRGGKCATGLIGIRPKNERISASIAYRFAGQQRFFAIRISFPFMIKSTTSPKIGGSLAELTAVDFARGCPYIHLEPDVSAYMSQLADEKQVEVQELVNEWLRASIKVIETVSRSGTLFQQFTIRQYGHTVG